MVILLRRARHGTVQRRFLRRAVSPGAHGQEGGRARPDNVDRRGQIAFAYPGKMSCKSRSHPSGSVPPTASGGASGSAGLQLVHDPGARLHHPVPVPQQLPQIAILPARYPDPAESHLSAWSFRISCASWRSVFCLRTRLVRISAASPIHNSKFSSASSRSNQRACPLASIPTRKWPNLGPTWVQQRPNRA